VRPVKSNAEERAKQIKTGVRLVAGEFIAPQDHRVGHFPGTSQLCRAFLLAQRYLGPIIKALNYQ
jgi:hypothetical protein